METFGSDNPKHNWVVRAATTFVFCCMLMALTSACDAPAFKADTRNIVEDDLPHAWCYTKNVHTLSCVPKHPPGHE